VTPTGIWRPYICRPFCRPCRLLSPSVHLGRRRGNPPDRRQPDGVPRKPAQTQHSYRQWNRAECTELVADLRAGEHESGSDGWLIKATQPHDQFRRKPEAETGSRRSKLLCLLDRRLI
jgi:hypothetical protein